MDEAQRGRGADPTRVIARMQASLGQMHTEVMARDCIIEDLEQELSLLKSHMDANNPTS